VGTLWADGRLISHATVLAPGVAVAPSFGAAQANLLKIGRRGGPTSYRVLQVTARTPFALLTYTDHGNGVRLGGGRAAAGAKLTFVAYDEKADQYFSAEGLVATTPALQIFLDTGFSILPSWTGAPAFDNEGLLTGMIGRGAGGPILLDVLPLDEMLGSCKELAGLLAPERAEQVRIAGVPTAAHGDDSPEDGAGTAANDSSVWERMSGACRFALARADAVRRVIGKKQVHTYHLVAGLIPAWTEFFEDAGVSEKLFRDIVRETFRAEIPEDYTIAPLTKLPPRSVNAQHALQAAVEIADRRGSKEIWTSDLLLGVLSLRRSTTLRALQEKGIRPDRIRPEDRAERGFTPILLERERDQARESSPDPTVATVATQDSPVATFSEPLGPLKLPDLGFPGYNLADAPGAEASPAPSVESDLWSEIDRLGYEAYARTIAKLITHRETKPPLTIGIKAPWGAGKTTLMKRVQHLLDGDADLSEKNRSGTMQQGQPPQLSLRELLRELKRSVAPARLEPKPSKDGAAYGVEARTTVWFNAWKYQTSEQVWAGMAHCIISQITARMETKERELFWARLHARRVNANEVRRKVYEEIARQLLPLALVVLVVCAVMIWVAAAIPVLSMRHVMQGASVLAGLFGLIWRGWEKLGEKAAGTVRELIREPDYEGKMGYLHLVESDIREVLRLATPAAGTPENPKENPLVVFVDDLDRCAPYKVAEVVEAINLFLCGDYPNCIFVLGMEPGMVAAALEVANKDVIEKAETMGLVDRSVPVGWRFMEKIVQLPIMIPPPTAMGRQRYVNSLTGVAAKYEMQIAWDAPDPNEPALAMGMGPGIMRVLTPRPPHGAEEEKKVQSYLDTLGPAKSANEAAKKGVEVVAQAPVEERWAAEEAGNRLYEQALTEHDPVMAKMVEEVARLVDGNPRQIKRYVNVFRFYSTLRQSLRLQGVIPSDDLPKDKVLAKFVALSIQWPHAVDCLRVKKELSGDDADGKKVSLLYLLETESKKMTGDGADNDWVKLVGKDGLGMGPWAERRSFREFLARGESLCEKEGHGLW